MNVPSVVGRGVALVDAYVLMLEYEVEGRLTLCSIDIDGLLFIDKRMTGGNGKLVKCWSLSRV